MNLKVLYAMRGNTWTVSERLQKGLAELTCDYGADKQATSTIPLLCPRISRTLGSPGTPLSLTPFLDTRDLLAKPQRRAGREA